jgi:hypothetical protein
MIRLVFATFIIIISASEVFASFEKLTAKNYEKYKNNKAVVIYGVNWGRQWGCAGLENAQIQNLTFSRIDSASGVPAGEDIVLNTPSKLFVDNVSKTYTIIVNPGEYSLTGFDIKIARSASDVRHIKVKDKDLFENGKPTGGSFNVNAGEVVYIGDFGLDCANEPIPWRYYIQKEDFERYVAGLKKKYKFLADKQIVYRLFKTNKFGQLNE